MANHQSAKKRIRQTATITERNRARRSQIRTYVKKLEQAIEAGNKEEIPAAFKNAMSALHKGVSKGVMKKETASRKISRLSARVKGMSA